MRYARWIGPLGAVVYAVGFVLVSWVPGGGDVDPSDFQDFYVEDDNTAVPIIGMFVLTVGVMALLWFFFSLRTTIATVGAAFGWAAAALGLTLVLTGGALLAAPSGVQAFSDADFVGDAIAHTFAQAGFATMLVPGSLLLGLAVAVMALEGRRARAFPSWVAIVGWVAAALQLGAIIWIPAFAVPLWVLIAGIATARSLRPTA